MAANVESQLRSSVAVMRHALRLIGGIGNADATEEWNQFKRKRIKDNAMHAAIVLRDQLARLEAE